MPLLPLPCSKARLNFAWADYESQYSTQELDAFDAAYEKRQAAPRGELVPIGTAAFALPLGNTGALPAAACCYPDCLRLHLAPPPAGSKPAPIPKPPKPAQPKQRSTKAAARAVAAATMAGAEAAAATGAANEGQDQGAVFCLTAWLHSPRVFALQYPAIQLSRRRCLC